MWGEGEGIKTSSDVKKTGNTPSSKKCWTLECRGEGTVSRRITEHRDLTLAGQARAAPRWHLHLTCLTQQAGLYVHLEKIECPPGQKFVLTNVIEYCVAVTQL